MCTLGVSALETTPDIRVTRPSTEVRFGLHECPAVPGESCLWDFHRGEAVTSDLLNDQLGDVQHVDHKLWVTLQYLMFYIFMIRRQQNSTILRVALKQLLRKDPSFVNSPAYEHLRCMVRDHRLQYFGSLWVVCDPEIKKDPVSVAAIFRIFLTLGMLGKNAASVLFWQHPEAIEHIEPQWHDRYKEQVKYGKNLWKRHGKNLLLEYQGYDSWMHPRSATTAKGKESPQVEDVSQA